MKNVRALALLVLLTGVARAYDEAPVEKGGSVSGTVLFQGTPPERKPIDVLRTMFNANVLEEEVIVAKVKDKQVLVNAVVTLVGITKGKAFPKENPVLDQKACMFVPHVMVVAPGAEFKVTNSDDCHHNVRCRSELNPECNNVVEPRSDAVLQFPEPERLLIRCEMHPWMRCWVVVATNPYFAVTGEDGTFKIDKIPAGTYKLTAWHETLGEQTREVVIKAGEDSSVEYSFKAQ